MLTIWGFDENVRIIHVDRNVVARIDEISESLLELLNVNYELVEAGFQRFVKLRIVTFGPLVWQPQALVRGNYRPVVSTEKPNV